MPAAKPPRRRIVPDAEKAFLARYKPQSFPRPSLAVDIAIFTIVDATLRVLLVRRDEHPFKGDWALPGGFVRVDAGGTGGEDLDATAARKIEEDTGLPPRSVYFEQLYTFGAPDRDPRTRVVSVAYYALIRPDLAPLVHAKGDATATKWLEVGTVDRAHLAFDHARILDAALARIVGKLDYSNIVFSLVPETFTITELRSVREIVTGEPQDPGNFRRRFQRMLEDGLIEQAPGKRITASKPATVYRFTPR